MKFLFSLLYFLRKWIKLIVKNIILIVLCYLTYEVVLELKAFNFLKEDIWQFIDIQRFVVFLGGMILAWAIKLVVYRKSSSFNIAIKTHAYAVRFLFFLLGVILFYKRLRA